MLHIYEDIPVGLLQCEAHELHDLLPGPSLIHIKGIRAQPLFVSVLLHGNETTGWQAVRSILQDFQGRALPRSMSLFIGNVHAAAQGVRHLDGQPDYNRIWKAQGELEEDVMVRQVLEEMRARDIFACLDIHNNTGRNPHYACVNRLATPFFQLATLFSRTVVYFLQPDSVLSMAFANLCPAVTVECGKASDRSGEAHAREFILNALALDEFSETGMAVHNIDLFHTVAIVKLREGMRIAVSDAEADIELLPDIDQHNFHELIPGTELARIHHDRILPVMAVNEFGKDVAERYFEVRNGWLVTSVPVMPSMITLDVDIIRQDCLCYLMERLDLSTTLST